MLLTEIKLNDLTNEMVKLIFAEIKKQVYKKSPPIRTKKILLYQYETPLEFDFFLYIRQVKSLDEPYKCDADSLNIYTDITNEVNIYLELKSFIDTSFYTKLGSDLKDYIRHELEHITQGSQNKQPNRAKPTSALVRNRAKGYQYLIFRDEIPAMVAGMYEKAKYEKKPIDIIFSEYLDNEIKKGIITSKEKKIVMDKWIAYTKKNYTSAKFSTDENIKNTIKSLIKEIINE